MAALKLRRLCQVIQGNSWKCSWFASFLLVSVALGLAALPAQGQTYTVVHKFPGEGQNGAFPRGALIQDSAGNIYGVTESGGATGGGIIFQMNPAGSLTVLFSLPLSTAPDGGLFRDPNGDLYGTGFGSFVTNGCGIVFKLDTAHTFSVLHNFTGPSGANCEAPGRLVSINGDLYGATEMGGSGSCDPGCGTIFKIAKSGQNFEQLYEFTGGADGAYPRSLIRDNQGNLYGTTGDDSATVSGTIFRFDTAGNFSTLHTFDGTDGNLPAGRILRDVNGNIRGVTELGGGSPCNHNEGCGVVFHLSASGAESTVHRFFLGPNGQFPLAGLLDVNGELYGTADENEPTATCPSGCGLLFKINKKGQYQVLHTFAGGSDGYGPAGELLLGSDGSIYGTTVWGGGQGCSQHGCGVVFKYTP